ncbi:MAG: hypothetical protein AB7I48_04215 [Planctomycetaceae bacterium]
MNPRDWFGVSVRVFALWPLLLSMENGLYFMDFQFGLASQELFGLGNAGEFNHIRYLVYAVGYALFALGLLRAAPRLVEWAYPTPPDDSVG